MDTARKKLKAGVGWGVKITQTQGGSLLFSERPLIKPCYSLVWIGVEADTQEMIALALGTLYLKICGLH